jgi:glutathione S-transferase
MHLWTGPLTRGDTLLLLLDEAGGIVRAQYEVTVVDIYKGEHRSDSFLAINPAGLVPVLRTADGALLTESHAIALHICAHHSEIRHLVPDSDPARSQFDSWLFFIASELEPCMKRFFYADRYTPDGSAAGEGSAGSPNREALIAATRTMAQRDGRHKLALAELRLLRNRDRGGGGAACTAAGPFALGGSCSYIDFVLVYWVRWFDTDFGSTGPLLRSCVESTMARPALTQRFGRMEAEIQQHHQQTAAGSDRRGRGRL